MVRESCPRHPRGSLRDCSFCEAEFEAQEEARLNPPEEDYEIGVRERMYERWLDRIAP